jgi:hypothetical protein
MTRDGQPENRWEAVNVQLTALQRDLAAERVAGFPGWEYLPSLLLEACRSCRHELKELA